MRVHDLPIVLHRGSGTPLAVQVADALRAAAGSGVLRVGDRLPSTRGLAARLGVSRTVSAAAYDQLVAEGWLTGRVGSGTFVSTTPATVEPAPVAGEPACRSNGPVPVALEPGRPCLHVLDRAAWRRAWRAAGDEPPVFAPEPAGLSGYRAAVVEHLLRHRGLPARAADVVATAGTTAAVGELAGLLPTGATVAIEEPGYRRAVGVLRARGMRVVPTPVDRDGLRVDELPAEVAAVYCTPAHQFPLGGRLSAQRRVQLVQRARRDGFLIYEDDYDGELRYDVAPLPLLAALGPDVVAHLGTTSKLLTPTLGVGWLVAPPRWRDRLLAARELAGIRPPPAGQLVFTALAQHGDLGRHLRRLRRELAGRRAAVVASMTAAGLAALGDAAGAHVVIPLPDAGAEAAVVARAGEAGVLVTGLRPHHLAAPSAFGIALGYAGPARYDLERATAVLADLVVEASA